MVRPASIAAELALGFAHVSPPGHRGPGAQFSQSLSPMTAPTDPALSTALDGAKAWPFEEARRLIARLDKLKDGKDKTVVFETGYGPSGLPHIGTFGEVARTSMVRHAFEVLTGGKRATRLICFSDDMDGLRKVPGNVPNQEMLQAALDKPLTQRARSLRQVSKLRPPQQRDAARLPRPLRLRLRVHLGDGGLHVGPIRRDASHDAQGLRQGDGHHPADAGPRAASDLFAVSPGLPAHRPRPAGADGRAPPEKRHRRLRRSRDGQEGGDARHRRARQVPVEGRLGAAMDRARRRLRDGRQGPDRIGDAVVAGSAGRSAARRRKASTTSCSSTTRARRSPSRGATG